MTTENRSHPASDHLALLYRLSQTFNSSLDLDEVLNRVMDEVIAATQAERGFVMLREADGGLVFRVARGMDQNTIGAPSVPDSPWGSRTRSAQRPADPRKRRPER